MKNKPKKPEHTLTFLERLDRLEVKVNMLFDLAMEHQRLLKAKRLKDTFGFNEKDRVN